MTEHSISLSRCTYLVGRATLPLEGLPGLVEGVNFLRDHGVAIWAGTYIKRGGIVVPLALRCDSATVSLDNDDAVETTKEVVRKTLDGCWVAWKVVRPRASSQKSIRICRRVDAVADDLAHLTLADITPAEAVDDPFRNLVGMKPQVELLRTISDAAAAYGRGSLESLHMVFEGKPGTGKTELARRTSAYMHKCGLTSGKFVKASAADLIAKHVGQTPGLVRAAFDRAEGGVLFIDEAYSLTQGPGNEFGIEAANTLVECMDERRDRVVVIAAGYPREMEDSLQQRRPARPLWLCGGLRRLYRARAGQHLPRLCQGEGLPDSRRRLPEPGERLQGPHGAGALQRRPKRAQALRPLRDGRGAGPPRRARAWQRGHRGRPGPGGRQARAQPHGVRVGAAGGGRGAVGRGGGASRRPPRGKVSVAGVWHLVASHIIAGRCAVPSAPTSSEAPATDMSAEPGGILLAWPAVIRHPAHLRHALDDVSHVLPAIGPLVSV